MSDTLHNVLDETLICSRLRHVTAGPAAWILLQEPGFIGFGVARQNSIGWPPGVQPDWSQVDDLRLFGEIGEWHVWFRGDGSWQSRLLTLQRLTDVVTDCHVLWGTRVQPSDTPSWTKLVEERGTELWLPLPLKSDHLPLGLKLKHVVDYDKKTGLAGIQDAALVALVSILPHERVWLPPPTDVARCYTDRQSDS